MRVFRKFAAFLLSAGALFGQVPEYEFYPEFRKWWFALPATQRSPLGSVLQRYRERLATQATPSPEIDRRLGLIRTKRQALEQDFWNRFFTAGTPEFNTAPNSFLVSVIEGRPAGCALDAGMGEGRSALYLAKLGWDVTGCDPADKAEALAQKRAGQLGLKMRGIATRDTDFDFGREQWDLILFSWMPPTAAARVVPALRPNGIVVFEGPRCWFEQNGLLKHFDGLRVLRYEDEVTRGDYFQNEPIPVVRLIAEKPAP